MTMRVLSVLGFALATCQGLELESMVQNLEKCWRYLSSGAAKAPKYHACFAKDAKFLLNGQPDPAPWGDLEFVQAYFSQVQYGRPKPLMPPISFAPNQITVPAEFEIKVLATKETIKLGPNSLTVTFNDAGEIIEQSVIADSAKLENLSEKLAPVNFNLKAQLENFLGAFKSKNVQGIVSLLAPGFHIMRNSVLDTADWADETLAAAMVKEWDYSNTKLEAFGTSSNRVAHAHIKWDVVRTGQPQTRVTFTDAWDMLFDIEGRLVRVDSVVDNRGVFALYEGFNDVLQQLMRNKRESRQSSTQQQPTTGGAAQ